MKITKFQSLKDIKKLVATEKEKQKKKQKNSNCLRERTQKNAFQI